MAENANGIRQDYTVLAELDFIFAKAELAKSYNGVAPVFNEEGRINIRKGRHPLLDPKKVVPIDVRLGADFRQLIVTGPNTGGKTVSLKTVGLLTLMGSPVCTFRPEIARNLPFFTKFLQISEMNRVLSKA